MLTHANGEKRIDLQHVDTKHTTDRLTSRHTIHTHTHTHTTHTTQHTPHTHVHHTHTHVRTHTPRTHLELQVLPCGLALHLSHSDQEDPLDRPHLVHPSFLDPLARPSYQVAHLHRSSHCYQDVQGCPLCHFFLECPVDPCDLAVNRRDVSLHDNHVLMQYTHSLTHCRHNSGERVCTYVHLIFTR